MIERFLTPKVLKNLADFPAMTLLGPRQAGQITLAHTVGATQAQSVYLDLESPGDRQKLTDPEAYLSMHEQRLVILDEVQHMPALFQTLRGLIDRGRRAGLGNSRFLLLGSASGDLMHQSRENLAGRIDYLERDIPSYGGRIPAETLRRL